MQFRLPRAFTLIELLVVIAIIALLVGILLPSLRGARNMARMSQSLANVQQTNAACQSYRNDYKAFFPIPAIWPARGSGPQNLAYPWAGIRGFASWGFAGKNCNSYWPLNEPTFDIEAADRPMNPYISNYTWDAPNRPAPMTATDPARTSQEITALRDPADNVTFQRGWNVANPNPTRTISAYDDVGTSYQYQAKWFDPIYNAWPGRTSPPGDPDPSVRRFYEAFDFGLKRMAIGEGFNTSKLVWVNDQWADVVANCTNPRLQLLNGFGQINMAVLGFTDGHAAYEVITPGASTESFKNSRYSMVFDDLKVPRN